MRFFDELKRRNVFKVALAYSITTWLIAQMAQLAADSFGAPGWVMKMLITILLLGFPVALVMAWAYEMTPDGFRRESNVTNEQTSNKASGKLDRTIVIALVAALAYIAYDNLVVDPKREAALLEINKQQTEALPAQTETPEQETEETTTPSIAVLPFINMSDDAGNEYFSNGLSEELLNLLVKISELQVAARTSSFSFKGKDVKIPQIAEELGVIYVLEGSVRKAGDHVRVTAQLIKAADGFHLWSETYDRTLNDIFVVQDDIARQIVTALKINLMGAVPETRQTKPEVYSLYLQARYFANIKGELNLEQAITLYQQALLIDPNYAPAWIGLSVAYQEQRKFGMRSRDEAFSMSMAATENALAIDNKSAAAWANLAYLKKGQLDWTGARTALDMALSLEPNNAFVIGSAASLAGNLGQLETSIELFERNVKLNPLGLSGLRALAIRYSDAGRFDEAIATYNRVIAINPDYPNIHFNIGATYLDAGNPEKAMTEINKNPSAPNYEFLKVTILSKLGREAEAQALTGELLKASADKRPIAMAITFAALGENDLAFEWYEKAFQQNPGNFAYFLRRSWNKGLESDPRYPAFVEKLGLLEAWEAIPKPEQVKKP